MPDKVMKIFRAVGKNCLAHLGRFVGRISVLNMENFGIFFFIKTKHLGLLIRNRIGLSGAIWKTCWSDFCVKYGKVQKIFHINKAAETIVYWVVTHTSLHGCICVSKTTMSNKQCHQCGGVRSQLQSHYTPSPTHTQIFTHMYGSFRLLMMYFIHPYTYSLFAIVVTHLHRK